MVMLILHFAFVLRPCQPRDGWPITGRYSVDEQVSVRPGSRCVLFLRRRQKSKKFILGTRQMSPSPEAKGNDRNVLWTQAPLQWFSHFLHEHCLEDTRHVSRVRIIASPPEIAATLPRPVKFESDLGFS